MLTSTANHSRNLLHQITNILPINRLSITLNRSIIHHHDVAVNLHQSFDTLELNMPSGPSICERISRDALRNLPLRQNNVVVEKFSILHLADLS
jgi:hypothetical protein